MGLVGVDKEGTKEMEKRVDKRERRDRADTWTLMLGSYHHTLAFAT
jgi:hypothetical protein